MAPLPPGGISVGAISIFGIRATYGCIRGTYPYLERGTYAARERHVRGTAGTYAPRIRHVWPDPQERSAKRRKKRGRRQG